MLWLTWRQHRMQAAATLAVLVLIAVYFLWSGLRAIASTQDLGLDTCAREPGGLLCGDALGRFSSRFSTATSYAPFINYLLVAFAAFLGAPLIAREVEAGTHRLAWTLGVSRRRWLATKLAVVLGIATVAAAAQGALFYWWYGTVDLIVGSRLDYWTFDLQGVVPIGYAVFAVAAGVAAGTVVPRTLGAMVAAAALFVGVRLAVSQLLREHYMEPALLMTPAFGPVPVSLSDAWSLDGYFVKADGSRLSFEEMSRICPDGRQLHECVAQAGIQRVEIYHPGDRFWAFQAIEFTIFIALAAALAGLAFRRLRTLS